ncbi:insulinase family protein [[Haemophilus] felis]|nr:insulinase family protein [[Haemophilus] felis]
MKTLLTLLFSTLFLLSCQSSPKNLNSPLPYHSQLRYGQLDNKLNYFVLSNPEPTNRVYIRLVVNAGSMHEDDDQKGVAHLVEHMAFNGSKKFPQNEIIFALEKLGMKFARDINAFTDFENTVYTLNLDKNDPQSLALALEVVNEWMHHLTILDKDLDSERGVVQEEWRRRLSPMLRLGDKKSAVEMAGSRYVERDPIGDMNIIRTISRQRVMDFYRRWYRPDNMSLIVVGDIDSQKMVQQLQQKFPAQQEALAPLPKIDFSIPLSHQLKVASISEKGTIIPTLEWSFLEESHKEETFAGYKKDLIEQILIRLINLRLQNWAPIEAQKIESANFYRAHLGKETQQSIFLLQLFNTDYAKNLQMLFAFLAEIQQKGFSQQEFKQEIARLKELNEKQKNLRSGSLKLADDMIIAAANQQTILDSQERYELNQGFLPEIQLADINQAFQAMLQIPSKLLLITQPYPATALQLNQHQVEDMWAQALNTAQQSQWNNKRQHAEFPQLTLTEGNIQKIHHWKKGDITEYQLSNGSRLIYHYSDKTPNQVSFKALSRGGLRAVARENYHLLRNAVSVVDDSGVGPLSLEDIQHIFAKNPIAFTTLLDDYKQGFAAVGKNHQLEALLKLFHLKLQGTPISDNAFNRYQKETRDHFLQQDKETAFIQAVNQLRYPNIETIYSASQKQLLSFTPAQLAQAYEQNILNNTHFTYFVIGDIAQQEVEKLAKRYLASVNVKQNPRHFYDASATTPAQPLKMQGLGEPRAEVEIYFSAANQWKPELQYQLDLLGDIVQEQLRLVLREQDSGIYAANAWFSQEKEQSAIEGKIEFSCAPERAQELIQHTEQILDYIVKKGVDPLLLNKKISEKHRQIKQQFDTLISVATIIEQSFWNENSPNAIYLYQQLEQLGDKSQLDPLAQKLLAKPQRFKAVLLP